VFVQTKQLVDVFSTKDEFLIPLLRLQRLVELKREKSCHNENV